MKNFEILKSNELKEFLDSPDLEELFENGEIVEEFKADTENAVNKNGYDPELKIY